MPGWTVFEQANGAKGIVPRSPGYPTGCRTLGYSWPAVVRKVKQMQREKEPATWISNL